ncbi:MAG: energy-coupling factor transporter transmembrane protein EcfT [Chloroflexota bacterium]|nr:energy-coupling factor transporter transmembrane protein EcfT [Chloroflexota bacterium]
MRSRFELYVSRDSWIHALDPRTKMAFVGASFAVLLPTNRLILVVGYLMAVHLLLWKARIPRRQIAWLWRQTWPVSLLILLLWPLSNPAGSPVLLEWWRVRITLPGIRQGLLAALRLNALAFAVFVLLLTTDQTAMVEGLVRLGLPFEWGLALAIGLRALPLLHGTYGTIVDAQRARGWTPREEGLLRRLRAHGPNLVALVIGALRLTDTLTLTLAARGFRPGHRRTTRRPLQLRRVDWACIISFALLAAVLIVIEIGSRSLAFLGGL